MTNLKDTILEMSRQDQVGELSPWFDSHLDKYMGYEAYSSDEGRLTDIGNLIIKSLEDYREQTGTSTAVIGMSGGVDSALTASLLKKAGWNVIGLVMPIHQNPEETKRGIDTCAALGIKCIEKDLSKMYDAFLSELAGMDGGFYIDSKPSLIRKGNIRARLRMITLYNLAAANKGLVASTDNYSELAVGFWTLHGDVGDLSPIQSLTKSWEVPMLAKIFGVPEETWRAKPTDGLGVANGDEDQFGFTYLELDLMLLAIGYISNNGLKDDDMVNLGGVNRENLFTVMDNLDNDPHAKEVFNGLLDRMGSTWFKRINPVNIRHPFDGKTGGRYQRLTNIDRDFFWPTVVK